MSNEPRWVQRARQDIGQRETLGPNDSPWIRQLLAKLAGSWLLGQPWCGGAVAFWLEECGMPIAKNWFRAKAWLDWGVQIAAPAVGAVVVFDREGGGHVGLVVGKDQSDRLMVLGGNQGNQVCVEPFDRSRILGYRWPAGEPLTMPAQLPILTAAGASSSNEA